ncbi:MAG: 4-(cytidine 5'-diphospho)-2-C-methyl-D-erythritol kinase [Proteobacteria bacterium]|jgi:4-diphosphocytidyl-2-C-methyl-D-erythritol kinase|nr:4-(cytidine 5'-diphospho)-2-C-methyl-D-erythritol kinase [Pseudomonadota bacterium]
MHTWSAPAKLNLFLHITGRRPDGYHLLQTVFQFLDYADQLTFNITDNGKVMQMTPLSGVDEGDDLTVRAAILLQAETKTEKGVEIYLNKSIPVGAGLGGGSSDAATTLLVLNELWGANLERARLVELALQLGADVPVFVAGHAAWAEGVGEILTPIEPEERWYAVMVPPVQVSTQRVFEELGLTAYGPPSKIRDFHAGRVRNDLEAVVRRCYPDVDRALQWLAQFGEARMTGSGACVYLPVKDQGEGAQIVERRPEWLEGFVARGVNRHPLSGMQHERSVGV